MNRKERHFNPYGLRARFGISLAVSTAICVLVFFVMNVVFGFVFTNYYEHSNFERKHIQKQRESLQSFIDTNRISSDNLDLLRKWEKKQPIILLELYAEETCIYSSTYDVPVSNLELAGETDRENCVPIQLMDTQVVAFIFSDFTYQYYVIGNVISIVAALVLFILLFLRSSGKLIRYICRLNNEVQILEGGNLEYRVSEEGNDELTDLAKSMNRMRLTLQDQMEKEQELYHANRQLITEMSHDLRTPLTGIMLYLEILRSHRYETDEQLQDYLEKIDAKAHHMKLLSDHLFEYSMQDAPVKQTEPLTMELAFRHAIGCLQEELQMRGFSVITEVNWEKCFVQVNPEYIHRIFENIISNIVKYAEQTVDVRVDTIGSDRYCGFSIMNSLHLNRTQVESNGIGIESILSMMKKMDGTCNVEQTDTTFEIILLFPKQ